MPIINVEIAPDTTTERLPERGYYVDVCYRYDKELETVTYGPFPMEKKKLFIEFMNLLEQMIALCPDGMKLDGGYIDMDGYDKWFDHEYSDGTPDDDFRVSMKIKSEWWYIDDQSFAAQLTEIKAAYFHDGLSYDPYNLTITKT